MRIARNEHHRESKQEGVDNKFIVEFSVRGMRGGLITSVTASYQLIEEWKTQPRGCRRHRDPRYPLRTGKAF